MDHPKITNPLEIECQVCKRAGMVSDEITLSGEFVVIHDWPTMDYKDSTYTIDESKSEISCKCSNGHTFKLLPKGSK